MIVMSAFNPPNSHPLSLREHYLDSYLREILPKLGLDIETYAPYVTGFADENDGDDGIDDLLTLLRESSESHGDEEIAWQDFKEQILLKRRNFTDGEASQEDRKLNEFLEQRNTSLQKDIQLAQKNALELEARKQRDIESKKLEYMSAEKISLMVKYAYESDSESDNHDEKNQKDVDVDTPLSNREYAAQRALDHTEKLKSVPKQTKKEAQLETKKARDIRNDKKEERRKRAVKGERRR